MAKLKSVYPISGEDIKALPVIEIGPAVRFYETILKFSVVSHDATTAVIERDQIRLGLIRQSDHQPKEAGSLAFGVDDLDAMHREFQATGGSPGAFGVDTWGGKHYRTFFLREDTNGYCYCFHQQMVTPPP